MKNTRVQHFDMLKAATLVGANKRPQDLLDEKKAGVSDSSVLLDIESNTRKEYLLSRRFSPGVGDIPFDHLSINRIAGLPNFTTNGFEAVILAYQVPSSSDMIVNQFNFFMLHENATAPFPRSFAGPLEFALWYDFRILANGTQPIIATNHFNFNPGLDPSMNTTGFVTLTEDPEKFSPSYDGMHFVVQKGALLQVVIHCHATVAAPPVQRNIYVAGSRLRGFLTNSEDLDRMNK